MHTTIPSLLALLFTISLQGQNYVSLPFTDDFESGSLSNAWTAGPDTDHNGVVAVNTTWGRGSTYGVGLGKNADGGGVATNTLDLHLDLAGQSSVYLSFDIRDFYETDHPTDGMFLSNDGGNTFIQVYTFYAQTWCDNVWGAFPPFDLDALAAEAGLSYTSQFIVRIQQTGTGDFNTSGDQGGLLFDNFSVYSAPPVYATLPFSDDFDDGSATLGTAWQWAHADNSLGNIPNATSPVAYVGIDDNWGLNGSYALRLGRRCDGPLAANAVDLRLNLANQQNVFLSFFMRDFYENYHPQDGIFLSDDGGQSFSQVFTFPSQLVCDNVYGALPPLSIDEMAAAAGLDLTDKFVIRFQQYDDGDFSTSGREAGITFDNVRVYSRPVTYASLPFRDNFDDGSEELGSSWEWSRPDSTLQGLTDKIKPTGFVGITNDWGVDGTYGVRMGKRCDDGLTANALDLHLDLQGQTNVFLSFDIRRFYENNEAQDGIYFSNDGGSTFTKVYNFVSESWCNNVWGKFPPLSVDELASAAGLELTGRFVVRFQQYGSGDFSTSGDEDGLVLDNVEVYSRPPVYASLPFSDNFDDASTILGPSWQWSVADSTVTPIPELTKPTGYVAITDGWGVGQSYAVLLGKRCDDGATANALDLHLDLEGESDVYLEFFLRSYFDENESQSGIFLSDDAGSTWQRVHTFQPEATCRNSYGKYPPFHLDALAARAGLEFTDEFIVRFQQYGNADFNSSGDEDGLALDDVRVYSQPNVYASLPYVEDFDDGTLELGESMKWANADSTVFPIVGETKPTGYVGVVADQGVNGSYGLLMGKRCDDGYTVNALDLHLDLSGASGVSLSFYLRDYFNEVHLEQDAIFFSNDGGQSFTKIYSFDYAAIRDNVYEKFTLDLDSLTQAANTSYSSTVVVRFQQYDDADFSGTGDEDGIMLDSILVEAAEIIISSASLPGREPEVRLFPNPSTGKLTVSSPAFTGNPVTIRILDATGRLVGTRREQPRDMLTLDLQYLSLSGLHLLEVTGPDYRFTRKIFFGN